MAGLLDMLNEQAQDPAKAQGILQFGLSLLQSKGNLGAAIGAAGQQGLLGAQQYRQQQFQKQQQQFQLGQQKRQQELQNLPAQFLSGGVKPDTMDNRDVGQPGEAPIPAQQFDAQAYGQALMAKDPAAGIAFLQSLAKPQSKYSTTPQYDQNGDGFVLDEQGNKKYLGVKARDKAEFVNGVAVNPYAVKPGTVGPQDPNKAFGYGPDGKLSANDLYQQYELKKAKAGASSVNVSTDNLGLKPKDRFEMEGKLGDDYRTAIKSDQAIIGSTGKIKALLTGTSPLRDQGAIYSFAKMLDPDGAVREADYAAIANSAGGADKLRNLVNKALTGEYLSPNQRKDMATVADQFEKVASERVKKANKLYGDQAKRYNLDPRAFSVGVGGEVDFGELK